MPAAPADNGSAPGPILIHSARKVDVDGEVDDFWLLTDGASIAQTGSGAGWRSHAARVGAVIDAHGSVLTPGFIDLHCHGGGGFSVEDGLDGMRGALAAHRAHGTTRSLLSLVANPVDELCATLGTLADLAESDPLLLGAHLEGPFLSPAKPGAHRPEFLIEPSAAAVERLIAAARGHLRQITLAPELPNAFEIAEVLLEADVIVAAGHTEADFETTERAFELGFRMLTHAFNAMNGIGHRSPGPIPAAARNERVTVELILDGLHVRPEVARILFQIAPGRVALVTDAMAAAGTVDGDYRLGTLDVSVVGGLALLRGTETIAGSTLTQDRALRIAIQDVELSAVEAVTALTATPAAALGCSHRLGSLRPDQAADLVLLDRDWSPEAVWGAGRRLA